MYEEGPIAYSLLLPDQSLDEVLIAYIHSENIYDLSIITFISLDSISLLISAKLPQIIRYQEPTTFLED